MATINLGRIKPVFRGAYAGGTAYVVDDIVTHGNETFICIQAGTGNATSNASYWTKLAAKGTDGSDGTDVSTTLTTEGDILYRDGSGLQRLPKGTAGQVLKMNSGATAPEYGTLSSDFVKLANHESTASTSSVSFDGYFSSDYDTYVVKMSVVDDSWIKFRFNVGGSTHTGGNWNWASARFGRQSNGNLSDNAGNFNQDWYPVFYHGLTNSVFNNAELVIHMPQYAGKYKTVYSHTSNYSGNSQILREDGAGYFHGTSGALSGFTVLTSNGGNFDVLSMQLYGLKK